MINAKEFIDGLVERINRGSFADLASFVFTAQKQTDMDPNSYPMDCLSAMFVLGKDVDEMGNSILDNMLSKIGPEFSAAQKAYEEAAAKIRNVKGGPAEALIEIAEKDPVKVSVVTELICGEINTKMGRIKEFYEKTTKAGHQKDYYTLNLPEGLSETQKFICQALAFFNGRASILKSSAYDDKKSVAYSPLVPLVATAILARNLSENQSVIEANTAANEIEAFLEPYIWAFIKEGQDNITSSLFGKSGKRVGPIQLNERLGKDDQASRQVLIDDATRMVARLLCILDQTDKDEFSKLTSEQIDQKQKEVKKYLHDLSLNNKLVSSANKEMHVSADVDADSKNTLSFVDESGMLMPVFEEYELEEIPVGAEQLLAFASNDGQQIWSVLKQIQDSIEGDSNEGALRKAIRGIYLTKYSGVAEINPENARELSEALADSIIEVANAMATAPDKFKNIVDDERQKVLEMLTEAKKDLQTSSFGSADAEAVETVKRNLATIESDFAAGDDSVGMAPSMVSFAKNPAPKAAESEERAKEKALKALRKAVLRGVTASLANAAAYGKYKISLASDQVNGTYTLSNDKVRDVKDIVAGISAKADVRKRYYPASQKLIDAIAEIDDLKTADKKQLIQIYTHMAANGAQKPAKQHKQPNVKVSNKRDDEAE